MQLLIVTGSARPSSVNQSVVEAVFELASARRDIEPKLADLVELDLPYVNSTVAPSSSKFQITDQRVQRWSDMVQAADAVLFIMPEYNHAMSAIQKNAFDWLYDEWRDKPVSAVAYSWHNAKYVTTAFDISLGVVKAKSVEPMTQLQFMEVLDARGKIVNRAAFEQRVGATLDSLRRMQ